MENKRKIEINNAFFRLLIEDVFLIKGRGTVVCGRVSSGELFVNSQIAITDSAGLVLKQTKVSFIDYGFIKSPIPKSATKDWNIGILFKEIEAHDIQVGYYVIIE